MFLSAGPQDTDGVEIECADVNILAVGRPPLVLDHVRGGLSGICIDLVAISNGTLTLHGWAIGYNRIDVLREGRVVRSETARFARPDVGAAYPDTADDAPGFDITVPNARPGEYSLRCTGPAEHPAGREFLLAIDFEALHVAPRLENLPHHFEDAETVAGAIDKVFNLGSGGLLVFGWLVDLHQALQSVTFHSEGQPPLDVTEKFFRTMRPDVARNLVGRHPQVTEMSGFVIRIDMDLPEGGAFGLCFNCGDRGQICLGSKAEVSMAPSVQLIKDVLTFVPQPERIRHSLFDLFDRILGEPITAVASRMRAAPLVPQIKQFGCLPTAADVSIIVPLYGRYDFLKYQMTRFHADADFARVDLIYVVDDPNILSATIELAALMYDLYGLPFRVTWYDRNLGFAGANNVGAAVAIAPKLLLLNSDVIPQERGWVRKLASSLDEQGVGAVGPLLQFYDGSVQHAGMAPNSSPHYPHFIFNAHPGKGAHWSGTEDAYEVPILTAACVMMHTSDYREMGGLDEGYIVGDFEDSDLCLKLRHQGLKLMLNPQTKLYHLERQSQNLEAITSSRHLLTLYNGWRYTKKILNGEIAHPGAEL